MGIEPQKQSNSATIDQIRQRIDNSDKVSEKGA